MVKLPPKVDTSKMGIASDIDIVATAINQLIEYLRELDKELHSGPKS